MKRYIIKTFLIISVILIFILCYLLPVFFTDIKLIGDENITLNYGEKYSESGYIAKSFGRNISKDLKIENNIQDEVGEYNVKYSYQTLFYVFFKERKIKIEDLEKPKIELKGKEIYELEEGSEYKEPGYTAVDNKDGNITKKVKVEGKVDSNKVGDYKLRYIISDKSNNTNEITRTVKITKKKVEPPVVQTQQQTYYPTTNANEEAFRKIVMVGDSNTRNMYSNGYIAGNRTWAIPCLHATTMLYSELYVYQPYQKINLLDAVSKFKPEKMIINFGSFSTAWISESEFLTNANLIIQKIKALSPGTQIMLISIYPITQYGPNINEFSQDTINYFNRKIYEIAQKNGLKYFDVQTVLKNNAGYGNTSYYTGDGYHLNSNGHRVVKEYIKANM